MVILIIFNYDFGLQKTQTDGHCFHSFQKKDTSHKILHVPPFPNAYRGLPIGIRDTFGNG